MKKKISTFAKEHDLSYHTVWHMVNRGELKSEKTPSGTILVIEDNEIELPKSKKHIVEKIEQVEKILHSIKQGLKYESE